jgi:hypothetical protein
MTVVSDSTPLIHLAQAGGLDVLFSLYPEVVITPTVHREAVEEGLLLEKDDARVIQAHVGKHIRVKAPGSSSKALARKHRIHKGEADSIQLAKELHAEIILMNEREGRRAAREEGLKVKGTIGIIFEALRGGKITRKKALAILKKFRNHPQDYWIDPEIIDVAMERMKK